MRHDPLCEANEYGETYDCDCRKIRRVREDERDKCWAAIAEIVPSELWNGAMTAWWIVKSDALAAIEALGGER